MDHGYITVAVRTAGGALPVRDAVVTVKDAEGRIIYVVFTDGSGLTPKLKLGAPPKANSEEPNAGGVPFYTYEIDTDKSGYRSVRNLRVPIYPGITSLQPVELLPLAEGVTNAPATFEEVTAPDL